MLGDDKALGSHDLVSATEQLVKDGIAADAQSKLKFGPGIAGTPQLTLLPFVVLSYVNDTDVRPYVVVKTTLKDATGAQVWSSRYISASAQARPFAGDNGWLSDSGQPLKQALEQSLRRSVDVMLRDVAGKTLRDPAKWMYVGGQYAFVKQPLKVKGNLVLDEGEYIAFTPRLGDVVVFTGVNIFDRKIVAISDATEQDPNVAKFEVPEGNAQRAAGKDGATARTAAHRVHPPLRPHPPLPRPGRPPRPLRRCRCCRLRGKSSKSAAEISRAAGHVPVDTPVRGRSHFWRYACFMGLRAPRRASNRIPGPRWPARRRAAGRRRHARAVRRRMRSATPARRAGLRREAPTSEIAACHPIDRKVAGMETRAVARNHRVRLAGVENQYRAARQRNAQIQGRKMHHLPFVFADEEIAERRFAVLFAVVVIPRAATRHQRNVAASQQIGQPTRGCPIGRSFHAARIFGPARTRARQRHLLDVAGAQRKMGGDLARPVGV